MLLAGAAGSRARVRGGGPQRGRKQLWRGPEPPSVPCHCWLCHLAPGARAPVPPGLSLPANASGRGFHWGAWGAGKGWNAPPSRLAPKAALGQSWNVGLTQLSPWDCSWTCDAIPDTYSLALRLDWRPSPSSWVFVDNKLQQLTGLEVPARRPSVHLLATVTTQATRVPPAFHPTALCPSIYLPIGSGHQP